MHVTHLSDRLAVTIEFLFLLLVFLREFFFFLFEGFNFFLVYFRASSKLSCKYCCVCSISISSSVGPIVYIGLDLLHIRYCSGGRLFQTINCPLGENSSSSRVSSNCIFSQLRIVVCNFSKFDTGSYSLSCFF